MRDLSKASIYDLDQTDFELLFCRRCKEADSCGKLFDTVKACQGLIDSGVWYKTHEKGN